jgi:hypothetical protein
MKQSPELSDDFISSAGVPTIPLKTTKKRSFADAIAYLLVTCVIVAVILFGHEFVYEVVRGFVTLYFGVGVVASVLVAVLGIVISNKWVLFAGLTSAALGVGIMLSELSLGVSIAGSLMIALLVYRWYVEKYHYVAERWPIALGIIALVLGLLLIVMQLQIIAVIIIAPVLLVVTGAMMIWELWRILRT